VTPSLLKFNKCGKGLWGPGIVKDQEHDFKHSRLVSRTVLVEIQVFYLSVTARKLVL